MTNAQIIFNESVKLMNAGIIGTTGRVFEYQTDNGELVKVPEPEPIHTYANWKQHGRQVKKGEHAKATFTIWKHVASRTIKDNDTGEEKEKKAKMIMKKAFFFTIDQT